MGETTEMREDNEVRADPGANARAEALGRKLMLFAREHWDADARVVARDYLRRFPQGTYAGAARVFFPAPLP